MSGKGIRVRPSNYTIVNNDVLKDKTLSWAAKGLYAYLRSNSSEWVIYKRDVELRSKDGRRAMDTAWKELEDSGWLIKNYVQEDGRNLPPRVEYNVLEIKGLDASKKAKEQEGELLSAENLERQESRNYKTPNRKTVNLISNNNTNNKKEYIYINAHARTRNNGKEAESQVELPDYLDLELWEEFLKTRTKLKCPNTKRALATLINKMNKLEEKKPGSANRALEEANSNGWKSVYEAKDDYPMGKAGVRPKNRSEGRTERNMAILREASRYDEL